MNPDTIQCSLLRAAARHAHASLLAVLLATPLLAQHPLDLKPAPVPDPVKGMHDTTPMPPAELAARRSGHPRRAAAAPETPAVEAIREQGAQLPRMVLFDRCGDGRLWARGASYKASFGPEGFVYVPFFGSQAPQNYPVHFVLRAVRAGGIALPLAAAEPVQEGNRVTFARGAVREVYDLDVEQVEQTFVVDTALAGDVEIEVEVVSELGAAAAAAGVQFGNALGRVQYGQANVVDGEHLRPVPTTCEGSTIRIAVPAAARRAGRLVVDPIINSTAFTGSFVNDCGQPDIAYDASTDQYLVVWQHHYSATDIDVWSQFWSGDGTVVPSTTAVIDLTTLNHSNPRVANLNAYDRFLVVMQRFEAGVWQIWGRLRLAASAPHPIVFPISDPAVPGHAVNPDIGGDSGPGDQFLVVWERQFSASDFDIHGRQVRADIALSQFTLFIENTGNTVYSLPQVSQSNGNGFSLTPRWMVVYQFRFSATDEDIYGAALAQNGAITTSNTPIDTSVASDLVPSVSSPNTDFTGSDPLFLVTYERQSPLEARARLLSASFVNQIVPVSLTASFGFGPFWVRAECDGNRFAVISGAAAISVGTLAYNGTSLVLQEAPLALPTVPAYPRLCSKRSGGGSHTDYGITFVDTNWFPDRIVVSAYRGHAPSANFTRRVMACNGLQLDVAGLAMLGETMTFSLSNAGSDIPGFAFGAPLPATPLLCGACQLGVDSNGAILLIGGSLPIAVPTTAGLVGFTAAVQGFAIGSGPCFLSLRFSDTIDFTIG